MDLTNSPNIGYTFWIVSMLHTQEDYTRLVANINKEGYRLSQPTVFIILDDRSRGVVDVSDTLEIDVDLLLNSDSAIYSLITTMGRKPILMLTGDNINDSIKQSLAVFITRQMMDTRCTIISEPLSVVNTMDGYGWQGNLDLSIESISTLRGIQFSRGDPITSLYHLTSYLLSCLNWEDPSLVVAGVAHISGISSTQLDTVLSDGSSCKGETTWDIHGYMILRVDKMHGYNLGTRNLSSILSSLGGKGFKLYSILLDSK